MQEVKALRYDSGKPDWTILDFNSVLPLVKVMEYGAKKYTRDNWRNKCDDPYQHIRCAFRHLIAIASGEFTDPESHEPHSGHVMANMMMFNYHMKDMVKPENLTEIIRVKPEIMSENSNGTDVEDTELKQ